MARRFPLGRRLRPALVQALESRRLFSAITWANRGVTSGANDDGFNSVFGGNATAARTVVDAVISSWARQINNFNYPGGGNTYSLTVKMATTGTSLGASGGPSHFTSDGKPDQGSLTIGRGQDTNGDGLGDGGGYFLDPTPYESSEYQSYTTNAFAAYAGAGSAALGKNDLYELCLHEVGHAVGFISGGSSTAFSSRFVNTNVGDTIDPPLGGVGGSIGYYYRTISSLRNLLTSYNSSPGGGGTDSGGPVHFAPAGAVAFSGLFTYYGADDLMTPYYTSSQRRLVSQNDINLLSEAYGYTVTPASYYGSAYDTLDNSGVLRIKLPDTGNDSVSISVSGTTFVVTLGIGAPVVGADPSTISSVFVTSAVSSISISTGAGNDTITLNSLGNFPVIVNAGSGTDSLVINGAYGTSTITSTSIATNGATITSTTGLESVTINGSSGNDVFDVSGAPFVGRLYANGLGGNDTLTYGNNDLYNFSPGISFDGGTGTDAATAYNGLTGHAWNYAVFQGATGGITSNDLTASYLRFDDLANVETIAINSGAQNDVFGVYYSGAGSQLNLYGGGGNDNYYVGQSLDGFSLDDVRGTTNCFGDGGTNRVYVDDTATVAGRTYAFDSSNLTRSGTGSIYYGFGIAGVYLSGSNFGSTYNFTSGTLYTVFGVTAGAGNDQFGFSAGAFGSGNYFNVSLAGGGGSNYLTVNDTGSLQTPTNYELGAAYFARDFGSTTRYTISYSSIAALTAYYGNNSPTTLITGVPVTPAGQQFTLYGGTGNEKFVVHPQDAAGNKTINGSLGIIGGAGTETFTIDDSGSTQPIAYTFSNPFGASTQDIGGMGAGLIGVLNDIPSIGILGGEGDDTFNIASFKSGQSLSISGQGGNDTVNLASLSNDVAAAVTSISNFVFDGGLGFDILNVLNGASAVPWTYTRAPGFLYTGKASASYYLYLNDPNVEYSTVATGSAANTVNVPSLAGVTFVVNSGGGADQINAGSAGSTQALAGSLQVSGDSADTLTLDDSADAIGRTFHTGPNTVAGLFGDDLLGPGGGSVYYYGAIHVVINLGSGADTVYAQPAASGIMEINAGDPTDVPGDSLTLALAAFPDAVVTPISATAGQVTFGLDQAVHLTYTGFETGPAIDNVAPTILGTVLIPHIDGSQDIVVAYSTALLNDPGLYALYLYNSSSGVASFADSEIYDPATLTSTFHFAPGSLAAGVYNTFLGAAYVVTPSGNALAGDSHYDFIWVPTGVTLQLPVGGGVVDTQQIAIDPTGTLDITDNALVVRNGAGSEGVLAALVAQGLNASGTTLWTGTGITSSLAAADTNLAHAVGLIGNSYGGAAIYDAFHGLSVWQSDLLIAYTVFGDADLSGTVDDTDYFLANNGFLNNRTGWLNGDFDYSGLIDDTDFFLLNNGFLHQ